ALEDITYSDDEEDVGAEANFSNLETNTNVIPIPTTRVHKDHPVTQIIGDLSSAPQTRSMTKMVKEQGFEDPDYPDKVYKLVKALYGLHQAPRAWSTLMTSFLDLPINTYGKSASAPIDTEKPLLKDPDGEDTNDVVRLQALKDRRKVINTEDTVRQALRLDDADIPQQVQDDVVDEISAERTLPSTTPATTSPPQQELIPSPSQVKSTPPLSPHQSLVSQPSSPPPQQPSSHDDEIFMNLLNTLLETSKAKSHEVGKQEKVESFRIKEIEKDADDDVTLEEVDAKKDAEVQGRLLESQAQVYHLDLEHAQKFLKVVTTATTPITAALVPKASAPRRKRGVIIQDPEEVATTSLSVQSEDKAFARELEAELDANINWNEVIEQVKKKERQDNTVMRYQALKKKPVTEAQIRKNMMVYLKNMAGFKLDFFKGMTYNDIIPIFEKHFNSIWDFLEKGEKDIVEENGKRKCKNLKKTAAKKQKINVEVKELKTHLQIIPHDEDDVYTEATLLALKVPVVDYQIHTENNKPYYKIIRADGTD
nr:retrotransposon protein, putative, unclassified [Tanacetum cinerariifolium]